MMMKPKIRLAARTLIPAIMLAALLWTAEAGGSVAQQVPSSPAPVAVTVPASTTALVVLDMVQQTCGSQPTCTGGMVPAIAGLLARARAAGSFVVYSTPPTSSASAILPAVAPAPSDPVVPGSGQDRFFNTNLDALLQGQGITTVILVGWREDGSVLYTAVGATLRGYTVVVPEDGTSAAQDYDIAIGQYMLLTQLNSNPNNQALKPDAVTLTRTDLISFM
jgi:nicotinamidase-related amidase